MLSWPDFLIVVEAIALAVPVELGLRCWSLDVLVARLERADAPSERARPLDVQRIADLVERAAGSYPFHPTCLKKSLVLLRILRKRGLQAELRIGVRKVHDDLNSHAWIECDGRTLLGGGVEHLYAALPFTPRLSLPKRS